MMTTRKEVLLDDDSGKARLHLLVGCLAHGGILLEKMYLLLLLLLLVTWRTVCRLGIGVWRGATRWRRL